MARFTFIALAISSLAAAVCGAPIPDSKAIAARQVNFKEQSYAQFQISDGVGGNAEAEANAVFVDPFKGVDLATIDDATLTALKNMRSAAEDAETELFNPAIDAASGADADALQVGKIKNKVLKLTGLSQVLKIQIAQAEASGDDTADLEDKLSEEQGKLTKNIATDKKSAGAASNLNSGYLLWEFGNGRRKRNACRHDALLLMNTLPPTLLSTIQNCKADDALASNVTHPFANSADRACGLLQDIIQATDQVANSLNLYLATNFTNQKLVSSLRQQAAFSHSLHLSEQNVQQTVDTLRKRSTSRYGEDIPLDRLALVEWCVSRFEVWGREVGMEAFREEKEGGILLVFGGKVLVIDVDFSVDLTEGRVHISGVKTSYAISSGEGSTMNGSSSLDAFLKASFQSFLSEVQNPEEIRNPIEAARLGKAIADELGYLVMLDKLAERKEDGGVRWFVDVDQLCSVVETFAKSEAQAVAFSLGQDRPPLDIFLHRSHALPLPYLSFPSLSFLVYMSPLAYLRAVRTFPQTGPIDSTSNHPQIDVSLTELRSFLADQPKGTTLCTLVLSPPIDTQLFPASMSMPSLTARPTFPLGAGGSDLEHVFPQLSDLSASVLDATVPDSSGHNIWMLDFTVNGQSRGIAMSQSRMRDIELVINPFSSMEALSPVGMMSFGSGSWVDLLRSPTSSHPPLQLRLTAPEEPGFMLEKVPVHSMKEAWGVLEVVREQCWLNETLLSCQWSPEGLNLSSEQPPQDIEVNEDVLQAVLDGTFKPRKIPVNVSLPSGATDPLFDSRDLDSMTRMRPRIVMTSPERPPISGLVEINVSYDETKPRGISVDVSGAMGADLKPETMEEICRRGGVLSLPGRIWAKALET
ncbi:hypothetical protein VNI00_011989 [Paramarasmius palmivorus]|uniref:Mediator complex subunit 1 n=1 Tax=Paramarasmius palmivorus TaxID=297713 RepID=A0AAW0CAM5_9AGAR